MADSTEPKRCPRCGAVLPADSPGGGCTRCLLESVLKGDPKELDTEFLSLQDIPLARQKIRYFGDYELLEELGRGGMGVVYRARQISLNREVAVKMILAGQLADEHQVARFRAEAEAAAKLDHPNIVPIYEVGDHQGQQYFSMKLVQGANLASQIGSGAWKTADGTPIAKLMATLSRAVHYAHQRGILHRDLKPANIILDEQGRPHITDFGLARRIDHDSKVTATGNLLGTPNYMAPEQASPSAGTAPSTAIDIYGLGSVLYELLAGVPPFVGGSPIQVLQKVVSEEPAPPRTLQKNADRDLETICFKCLEKHPERRYSSADALADDLQRWLEGKPILARPTGAIERGIKWSRRHPAVAVLCGVVMLVAILGVSGIVSQWRRAEGAALRFKIELAERRFEKDQSFTALALLSQAARKGPSHPIAIPRLLSALTWRSWPLPLQSLGPVSARIENGCLSPSGRYAAVSCNDGSIWLWDDQGRVITNSWPVLTKGTTYGGLQFSAEGKYLMALTTAGTLSIGPPQGPPFLTVGSATNPVTSGELMTGAGVLVAVETDNEVKGWSFPAGRLIYSLTGGTNSIVAFSPDERCIGISSNSVIRFYNVTNGENAAPSLTHPSTVTALAFEPKGTQLLICAGTNAAMWRWEQGVRTQFQISTKSKIATAEFDTTGSRFALFCDSSLSVWELPQGRCLFERDGKYAPVGLSGTFSENSLVVDAVRTTFVLNPLNGDLLCEPIQSELTTGTLDLSPDGLKLFATPWENRGTIWDISDGRARPRVLRHNDKIGVVAFSADGRLMASGGNDNLIKIWDTQTWQQRIRALRHPARVTDIDFSSDGRKVVASSANGTVMIWNVDGSVAARTLLHSNEVDLAKFSPDASSVITATTTGELCFWNTKTGARLTPVLQVNEVAPKSGPSDIRSLKFNPDGDRVLVACQNGSAQIYDVASGHCLLVITQDFPLVGAWFSADGRRITTANMGGSARIWDSQTGAPLSDEFKTRSDLVCAAQSYDRQKLVTGPAEGPVRIWSATTGALLAETDTNDGQTEAVGFAHSGRAFGMALWKGNARLLDTATAAPLTEWFVSTLNNPNRLVFSPDDHWLVVNGWDSQLTAIPQYIPGEPIPDWLLDLAEAVARERVRPDGILEPLSPETFIALRKKLQNRPGADFYSRWVRWFLADRKNRAAYPDF